jgi:integrase
MPRRALCKVRLTQLKVQRAKASRAALIIWDEVQRGLALRVQPSGGKSWYCVYSRQGRSRWLRLGHADAIALGDARMLAGEAMLAVARGHDPAAEKKAERGAGTFAELHERYRDQHAKKKNKSWRQADALVRRFALPRWGKLQASAVTRSDIKTMMAKIEAPIVANQTLAAVSAVFSWAMKEEIVGSNPCKLVARNETKSRERVLATSELPQVWAAFADAGPVAGSALKMILLTGQRPGEVASMRREHLKDGWWEMPGAPIADVWPGTKNGQGHRVWIPKVARELLGEIDDGHGYVFAGARGAAVSDLDDAMRAICRTLDIERATPHDLRRTHGSTITALGFGRDAMNRIQNHREGGIADVYDRHHCETETKTIMETVAARLMALAEGRGEDGKVVALRRGVA